MRATQLRLSSTGALERAAIIVASLGSETAALVGQHLGERQVRAIAEVLARMSPVSIERRAEVLREFAQACAHSAPIGGPDYASEFMTAALGHQGGAGETATGSSPGVQRLYALNELKARTLWRLLERETAQTVAVIVTHLTAPKAADLLLEMPEELRAEVAYRAAHLAPLSPGALDALASAFDGAAPAGSGDRRSGDSLLDFLGDVVMELDAASCRSVLEGLKTRDESLYQAIDDRMFTFEDTLKLADRDLQVVLRSIEVKLVATALKGSPEGLRGRALDNLSQRAREVLLQEMELMGPIPLTDVSEAQREIAAAARALAQSGEIATDRAGVVYVE